MESGKKKKKSMSLRRGVLSFATVGVPGFMDWIWPQRLRNWPALALHNFGFVRKNPWAFIRYERDLPSQISYGVNSGWRSAIQCSLGQT